MSIITSIVNPANSEKSTFSTVENALPDGNSQPDFTRAARALAAEGYYVFPCRPNAREPAYGCLWKEASTNKPEEVFALWEKHGTDCNIGIDCGKSGIAVIDIDVKYGKPGDSTWAALRLMHGDVPPTRTHRTTSNGRHLLFRQPGDIGGKPLDKDCIDIRGIGGYIVGPGSIIDGRQYIVEDDAPIGEFPAWAPDIIAARHSEKREAPEGFEHDTEWAVDQAKWEIARWVDKGWVASLGNRNRSVASLAGRLKGLGISEGLAVELIDELYIPHGEAPDEATADIVASMYRSAVNPAGSELRPSASQIHGGSPAMVQAIADADIEDKFMRTLKSEDRARIGERIDAHEAMFGDAPLPPRRELVPGWLGAGYLVLVAGQGGVHKSRLLMQLGVSLSHGNAWIPRVGTAHTEVRHVPFGDGNGLQVIGQPPIDNGYRSPVGVKVGAFEYLSYEDPCDEVKHRLREIRRAYGLQSRGDAVPFGVHDYFGADKPPLLRVIGKGTAAEAIKLTEAGKLTLRMMDDRSRELAKRGEHLVIVIDGANDAIRFGDGSKSKEEYMKPLVTLLNDWCTLLNATILLIFHQSYAGAGRDDIGYATSWRDATRQSLMITKEKEKDTYDLKHQKWSYGAERSLTFRPESGRLTTHEDINSGTRGLSDIDAAMAVVKQFTYRDDRTAIERLLDPALDLEERKRIECEFPDRFRADGCKFGSGNDAKQPALNAPCVKAFQGLTHKPKASVNDLFAAFHQAIAVGKLHRISDVKFKGGRVPAGYALSNLLPSPKL